MNLHHAWSEYFLMLCVLLQCACDLLACNLLIEATPVTHPPVDEQQTEISDSIDLGITNLLNLMESINSDTNYQLVNQVMDERAMFPITSATQLNQLNDPEYQRFGCEVQCGVRPAHSTAELKRIQTVLPSVTSNQPVVVDCTRIENTSNYANDNNNNDSSAVNVDCIAHYTGRLIHLIVTYDKTELTNKPTRGPIILGDRFSEQLQHLFEHHVLRNQKSVTSLYVTLDLPLRTLDAADLIPVASNLKYLAISSHSIQAIDPLLLQNLHLDYFILDGCHRIQERVNRPPETKISPLPARAHRLNCVVIWSFACPTAGEFELLADAKTQERLCQRVPAQSNIRLVSPVQETVQPQRRFRTRTRRSISKIPGVERTPRVLTPNDPWPFFAEKLIHRFEDEIKNFGKDVRRDISWYQTMMNLFIAILAFALLILSVTLVAFWIFLRQVLRGKIKPIRATI